MCQCRVFGMTCLLVEFRRECSLFGGLNPVRQPWSPPPPPCGPQVLRAIAH